MENNCNYSDDWQPYTGDYDKFEYDIKLNDGTIISNCYPNAGIFHCLLSGQQMKINEKDVAEIRFSKTPIVELKDKNNTNVMLAALTAMAGATVYDNYPFIGKTYNKNILRGNVVGLRNQPKIGRNEVCPKCESGKKFKKCCGIHLYNQR